MYINIAIGRVMIVKNKILEDTEFHLLIECAGCQASVKKYKSQLKVGTYAFCSRGCRNKNYKKVHSDWRPPNYLGPVKHTCVGCFEDFYVERANTQNRQYCTVSCFGKHRSPHSDETKAKMSVATIAQAMKYGGLVTYDGINGLINMRSGWEVKYAEYLDANNTTWEYEPRSFILSSGKRYLPDFQLDSGVIIEIRGRWQGNSKEKWDLFCSDYPDVDKQVLRRADLKQLGVL